MKRALAAAALLFATSVAAAEDEATCQTSYVAGQRAYKLDHDLLRGREQLLVCAKTCPDELRASCGKWLKEIDTELPSVVIRAKNGRGDDASDVSVDVDGTPITTYAEGLPLEVNPGQHVLRVHDRRGKVVERPIVVNAGEKLKVVDVWLEPRLTPVVHTRRPAPLATWVLLGVGAAAVASFATFAIWTTVEFQSTSSCNPVCDPSSHDGAFDAKAAVADVSLAVSGAALVAAAIVYLTRPKIVERTLALAPVLGPRVAGASIAWSF